MPIYKLKKDEIVQQWWRDYYEVEADSEEEAVQLILDNEVDPYDSDMFVDSDQTTIKDSNEVELYNSKL